MESMKRVDVLKSIEQILVQKAYETGHISHRADGDWQKTNNGWVRVKGSPAQSAPDTDDSAERAEYERQLTEEQNRRAEDDPTGYGYEEPPSSGEYGEITEEDLKETPEEDIFSEEAYEQDNEDRESMSAQDTVKHLIDNGDYDERIKNGIEFRDEGDGELVPHDDDYYAIVDEIWSDNDGFGFSGEDFDDEDSEANQLYDYLVDKVTDRAYELHNGVEKSAIRDMRSAPTTKNMGF